MFQFHVPIVPIHVRVAPHWDVVQGGGAEEEGVEGEKHIALNCPIHAKVQVPIHKCNLFFDWKTKVALLPN